MEGTGFVSAKDLQPGDIIRTSDGKNLPIEKIEVEDFHTYYVSELGVLVHNMCCGETGAGSATKLRNSAGTVTGGEGLSDASRMMRGTDGNIGVIPKEIADNLRGKEFKNFDAFREEFWKTVAESKYAKEFSAQNIGRMKGGYAPQVANTQQYGAITSYILHHKTPIHAGGAVYDLDNLVIVTPRMHQEILDKAYHFGN